MVLKLTLCCGNYDRTRALMDGIVKPEGIDLTYISLCAEEAFWRMLQYLDFEISEMSLSNYLTERSRPNPRFIAIPVFTSRSFRHSFIFISKNAKIERPQDLIGKKIGVPEYSMTATLWQRGLLEHEYGVKPSDVLWFTGGQEVPGRKERIIIDPPKDVIIKSIGQGQTLNEMLRSGEIDGLITARVPSCFYEARSSVKRLFVNYAEIETEYYKKTKIFPIMHTIVIKTEIYKRFPWVSVSLYKAFCQSKAISEKRLLDTSSLMVGLPLLIPAIEKSIELFGTDFWPYGIAKNYNTLATICEYSFEQGLSKRKFTVEELFASNTHEEYKI